MFNKLIRNLEAYLMKNGEIKAVHDKDLVIYLQSLGEYEKVISGNAKCFFCNSTITLDNIQSIFPQEKNINYCCLNNRCYNMLLERGKVDA